MSPPAKNSGITTCESVLIANLDPDALAAFGTIIMPASSPVLRIGLSNGGKNIFDIRS
jgi:hypothetical protein